MDLTPKLRNADKIQPPYPLGNFPTNFINIIGREVVYLLCTKATPSLEGDEWERIFATAIGAEWKPSSIGLDDVILGNCAWSAKTVKGKPTLLIANTIKGCGSSVMEDKAAWHHHVPNAEEYDQIMKDLEARKEAALNE